MGRLRGRQIGLYPNPVAGSQIRHLRCRQNGCAAGDFDVEGGPGKVEWRRIGLGDRCQEDCQYDRAAAQMHEI